MAQITRVFDSPGRAQAARDDLKAQGFSNAELAPAAEGQGRTTLRLDAPFGTGLKAETILDRHAHANGSAAAAPQPATAKLSEPAVAQAKAAPPPEPPAKPVASKRNGPHDGVRKRPRTLSQMLGIPELIDSDTFFSGFPLLIRPTPKRAGETTKRS